MTTSIGASTWTGPFIQWDPTKCFGILHLSSSYACRVTFNHINPLALNQKTDSEWREVATKILDIAYAKGFVHNGALTAIEGKIDDAGWLSTGLKRAIPHNTTTKSTLRQWNEMLAILQLMHPISSSSTPVMAPAVTRTIPFTTPTAPTAIQAQQTQGSLTPTQPVLSPAIVPSSAQASPQIVATQEEELRRQLETLKQQKEILEQRMKMYTTGTTETPRSTEFFESDDEEEPVESDSESLPEEQRIATDVTLQFSRTST